MYGQRGSFKCGYINIIAISQDEMGYIQMKTAREVLIDMNPQGKIATAETFLIKPDVDEIHYDPIILKKTTGEAIKIAAYKTHGTAGPSEIDAYALVDLCNALAEIARVRHLCMSTINPQSLSAFVACRLIIPLKKKKN